MTRHWILPVLLIFIFLEATGSTLPQTKNPTVSLRAYYGPQTLWRVSVEFRSSSNCQINRVKSSKKDCEELFALLKEGVKLENPRATKSTLIDEPQYEIQIEDRKFALDFRAPEECQTDSSGKIKCTQNNLNALEKLLLELRKRRN